MSEEPGKKRETNENEDAARQTLADLMYALENFEKDPLVDLEKSIWNVPGALQQKLYLIMVTDAMKGRVDYLDEAKKKLAEDSIIKAEIYLAAHEPKKEE
jgi:hypothetical protein